VSMEVGVASRQPRTRLLVWANHICTCIMSESGEVCI
jgi:hypothetical protein